MTFSEEYIRLCVENAGKFGEWEPKEGDWVSTRYDGIQVLKTDDDSRYLVWHIGRTYPDLEEVTYLSGGYTEAIKKECVWLPTLRQLIDRLEETLDREEGQISFEGPYPTPKTRYGVHISTDEGYIYHEGPDPESAVLGALTEALEKEE